MGRPKGSKGKKNKTDKPTVDAVENPEQKDGCDEIIKQSPPETSPIDIPEVTVNNEKKAKLTSILRDFNKKFGKDAIKFADKIEVRERLSFGHPSLDKLTGGGIPAGLVTTMWGSKGCSKTTIALDLIASAQKANKQCIYINGERGYDPVYASKRSIKVDDLVVVDVETLEQGLDVIIKLCREKVADLIVFDSLHGIAPKGELFEGKADKEKSVDQDTMALRARKLSQFFEMSMSYISEAKCAILMIGQSRMDLGGFIKLETLTGGHALLHNSRLILKLRRGQKADAPTEKRPTGAITEKGKPEMEDVQIGFDLVVSVNKSQIEGCTELSEVHLPFFYETGIKD